VKHIIFVGKLFVGLGEILEFGVSGLWPVGDIGPRGCSWLTNSLSIV